jgi:enoyl-CoA hydratase/carnithine racemase
MSLIEWSVEGNVALLNMNSGENRLNIEFTEAMLQALDDIEKKTAASALVVMSRHEKIWSNGLDLEWLMPAIAQKDPLLDKFYTLQDKLMKRILMYPMITVAALNGHTFAAGAILSCCFDFRFMRADRGFVCFPEVDINVPFLQYVPALIKKTMPANMLVEAGLTGKRFTAAELEKCGYLVKACAIEDLVKETVKFASGLNKGRSILTAQKNMMYDEIVRLIDTSKTPELNPGDIPIK